MHRIDRLTGTIRLLLNGQAVTAARHRPRMDNV